MKNEVIETSKIIDLECCDLNHEGLGVVKDDGFPYFVSDILVGEKAKFKLTKKGNNKYGTGCVIKRYNDSISRVTPICKNFINCGGCDLMHMNYEAQLKFKLKMVNETFKRIGHLDFEFKDIIGADNPYKYRNKVQIPYQNKNGKVICGFYQKKSHDIIELKECLIQSDLMTSIAVFIRNVLNELKITAYDEHNKYGIFRHLLIRKTYNEKYMVVMIVNDGDKYFDKSLFNKISDKLINRYQEIESIILNYNNKPNNVVLGENYELLYGADYLEENILGLKFKMSHKAFFQINHEQTEKLYSKVLEFADISSNDTVLDCYCGVGTISLLASRKAKKVIGIEIIPEAITNANDNALLNGIKNNEFIVGKSEEEMEKIKGVDVLIVDPPRKGMDKTLVDSILKSNIKKMVYVSCDCATMARDISMLQEKYSIVKGVTVDLFPQTADVESLILLKRK